jgi:hypothetical protein
VNKVYQHCFGGDENCSPRQKINKEFPQLPCTVIDSLPCSSINTILYEGKIVAVFPQGTPRNQINDGVTQFFTTLERKEKVKQI